MRDYLALSSRVPRWAQTFVITNKIEALAFVETRRRKAFVDFNFAKFARIA